MKSEKDREHDAKTLPHNIVLGYKEFANDKTNVAKMVENTFDGVENFN